MSVSVEKSPTVTEESVGSPFVLTETVRDKRGFAIAVAIFPSAPRIVATSFSSLFSADWVMPLRLPAPNVVVTPKEGMTMLECQPLEASGVTE